MKLIYADMQFFILQESTDSFDEMEAKLSKAFNCKFDIMRDNMVVALGLIIELNRYKRPDGKLVYTLFGRMDPELVYSETSPHRDIDAYEWFPAVGLDYFFITILQAAGCGIWQVPTHQDEQDMEEYAPF